KVLLVALLCSLKLRNNARSIVCAELLVSHTAGPGADPRGCSLEADGLEAGRVVGTNGRSNDKQESRAWRSNAESLLRTNHGGAEVERVSALVGNKPRLQADEPLEQLNHGLRVEAGKGNAGRAGVHA